MKNELKKCFHEVLIIDILLLVVVRCQFLPVKILCEKRPFEIFQTRYVTLNIFLNNLDMISTRLGGVLYYC